ncbi:MBL fold metallo-hydrolase [Pontibaca methylaminivorans]|mgnify:CR=1 FL=1|uniref:MBL fold metallo-hydrolase n=1 Tax=Pontibaca methylaminivorans TaxID=515897 RepID=UPI002FDB0B36
MNSPCPDFVPEPGRTVTLVPGLRRILAPNPSPMTGAGTNTYLLGTRDLAVIDPGPASRAHLDAIRAALGPGQRISHIFVTHSHLDHSALAGALARDSGAPVFAFGDSTAGRSPFMTRLLAAGLSGGGEGIDRDFAPDRRLCDGESVAGDGWHLRVIHTPGHFGNHIALAWGRHCFTGDHVMGWASSLVSPPDGDLGDFMASCERLRRDDWDCFHPGHGAPVTDPAGRLDWLMAHRRGREAEILRELAAGSASMGDLTRRIYADTPATLLPAAERNVLAHLLDLLRRDKVRMTGPPGSKSRFSITSPRHESGAQ